MRLLVKLAFAADLTLFTEYTIIIYYKEPSIPSPNLWSTIMGRGTPPSCTLSLRWLCGHIVRWLAATFMPPHLCHGHNCGSANPLLKILRTGLYRH